MSNQPNFRTVTGSQFVFRLEARIASLSPLPFSVTQFSNVYEIMVYSSQEIIPL
jgi:hypothetical protein